MAKCYLSQSIAHTLAKKKGRLRLNSNTTVLLKALFLTKKFTVPILTQTLRGSGLSFSLVNFPLILKHLPRAANPKFPEKVKENASGDHHAPGGTMWEPDRDGVLEAALPRTWHQQGWHSRRFRYSGPPLPPSLFLLSLSLSCQKNEVFLLGFHAYANGDRCFLLLIVVTHCTLLDLDIKKHGHGH